MYIPLFAHSHYSVLHGLNNPKEIVSKAKELGLPAIALTDIDNCSGCIEFYKEAKKQNIKPIIGSLINIEEGTLLLIAKNNSGLIELYQILAKINSNKKISLIDLSKFDFTDIYCIVGHEGSVLYNSIVHNYKIKEASVSLSKICIDDLLTLFGYNLFIELQFSEYDLFSDLIKEKYLALSDKYDIPLVACPRVYYLDKVDQDLHQILISIREKKHIDEINKINQPTYKFFNGYDFFLPSSEEFIKRINNQDAIENTLNIANSIEDYKLSKQPTLPKFSCPDNKDSENYTRELCQQSWKTKLVNIDETVYKNRLEMELSVFKQAGLFDYFLIIKDILDFARSKGYLVGVGRGSSSGCLVSYLLNITQVDPIKHNLLFERFYNAGREKSFPDIDCDFEARSRDDVIEYITKKYGKNNVAQIATYGTLMGRAALKAIFRTDNDISFAEQNEITKVIPDKARISDELQNMKNAGEEASVIKWTLLNKKKHLEQWCFLENGKLEGPLAEKFKKAIKLEGVISTRSRHAAGVVIGPSSLKKLVPLILDDKNNKLIIGCPMGDLDEIGLLKMDILGLTNLDKIKDINEF